MERITFVDSEISKDRGKICDLGAVKANGEQFHSPNQTAFSKFVFDAEFICGHNIVHHDLRYIGDLLNKRNSPIIVDTLYISPLVFPRKPYHNLLKDDKIQSDSLNNPLNDSLKVKDLFFDEVNAFQELPNRLKRIFCALLFQFPEFKGFFQYNKFKPYPLTDVSIKTEFDGEICTNADIDLLIKHYPVELAYALAIIACDDKDSITPPWVLKNYPKVENVIKFIRYTPCKEGCKYCKERLDVHQQLQRIFGFPDFRKYNDEPLQEKAAIAAVEGKSLLAVFPTGGGKSITFQLPALIAGETAHGLTIVISPLQSLMKDQVDNLEEKGITDAVTINGLLSPIERAEAIERIITGKASILYISPEQLRSKTIEKLLISRNIARFVIDEAHCFSAWGQDFRVDYLYIGDFIKELQKHKGIKTTIPVSCFTATAKQKVISDICDYFKKKLDLELELFATNATRENLHYSVLFKETEEEKYNALRSLIEARQCSTIVYVSRTRRTYELAEKLSADGFPSKPFNGKMESSDKIANQEAFINNEIQVIVATSAFGMGVDKKDVKLVIHYDISDSLENYVQEAGRAGRDQTLKAECFVLFNDNDLDKHFILLNQTKLSISEIQQVWKAIKDLTKMRQTINCSPLEIARQAGWDDSVSDIETRVKTALAALENAGYIKRGRNMPRVFATSILAKNMQEAALTIDHTDILNDNQKTTAKRIIKYLISSRSIADAGNDEAESRVDYIADRLGIEKSEVIASIDIMREIGLLADSMDMSAYIHRTDSQNKSQQILDRFAKLEEYLLQQLNDNNNSFNLKELNDSALNNGITSASVKNIRTILYYWTIKNYIKKSNYNTQSRTDIFPNIEIDRLINKFNKRRNICCFIIDELYRKATFKQNSSSEDVPVIFSLVGLFKDYNDHPSLDSYNEPVSRNDIADALLYLSKIGSISLQGGFLVLYNGMEIKRLVTDNKIRYKNDNYRMLSEFYKQKIQQIHIVGEYANLMVRDYNAALQFVNDYFSMDFKKFIAKYFKGERAAQIERNITPKKYHQLFDELSGKQFEIINDDESKYIVVAAGPGSGKTRVLVHKLAALLLLEDVKHEQLLMVTFSRAAATEFKKRLIGLIGNAAHFVEIKTFHSYCFDLLGKIGNLEDSNDIVKNAAEMINNGEVEFGRITKTVLVIDEAQDMDENEFNLIRALMNRNDDMRVIAVGDDDQNIYEFRGSNSNYLKTLITEYGAQKYEMTENFRSKSMIVDFANYFVGTLSARMKVSLGQAVQSDAGVVQITHYISKNLEEPVVAQILEHNDKGRVCVLTNTNDEALRVVGLLIKNKRRAKLIQSIDGFQLNNLIEIRYFLKEIDKHLSSPVISNETWNFAKYRLKMQYKSSECLDNCLRLISEFEAINKTKYRTDLEEFIRESKYEDFYTEENDTILVSTIHKAKGREFDCVYLLLNNVVLNTDEQRRKIYVGITRAKERLYVHYNTNIFSNAPFKVIEDINSYDEPDELTLQLTHRDVVLDFFKDKTSIVNNMRSGDVLQYCDGYLSVPANGKLQKIVRFSNACLEKIRKLNDNGYTPISAKVRYEVLWKGKEDEEETAIVLPEIVFGRVIK